MTMLEPFDPTTHAPTVRQEGGTARGEGGRPAAAAVAADLPVRSPWPDGDQARDRDRRDGDRLQIPRTGQGAGSPDAAWSSDWLRLSHELRTPLNAILGNIELLLDGSAGPLSAPARACIGDLQVASRQLMGQLQPLLLLVQARTSAAPAAALPLDLLELVRRASADRASADRSSAERRAPCLMSEGTRLMVPGDPVWLGALAATLVELHAAATGAVGPMAVELEHDRHQMGGVMLRVAWDGFDPGALAPLSLAVVDAVLQLHAGCIRSLSEQGLRLDLPTARIEPRKMAVDRESR